MSQGSVAGGQAAPGMSTQPSERRCPHAGRSDDAEFSGDGPRPGVSREPPATLLHGLGHHRTHSFPRRWTRRVPCAKCLQQAGPEESSPPPPLGCGGRGCPGAQGWCEKWGQGSEPRHSRASCCWQPLSCSSTDPVPGSRPGNTHRACTLVPEGSPLIRRRRRCAGAGVCHPGEQTAMVRTCRPGLNTAVTKHRPADLTVKEIIVKTKVVSSGNASLPNYSTTLGCCLCP